LPDEAAGAVPWPIGLEKGTLLGLVDVAAFPFVPAAVPDAPPTPPLPAPPPPPPPPP